MKTSNARLLLASAVAAAFCLLPNTGCATADSARRAGSKHPQGAPAAESVKGNASPAAPPAGASAAPDAPAAPARESRKDSKSNDAEVKLVLENARAEYEQGVADLRAGEEESARVHFDRAVETLLDSPVAVRKDSRLQEAWGEMLDSIHAMELESLDQDDRADTEPAPVEELEKDVPAISPETEEKERALVESVDITYDIPMELNDQVLAWIDAFSGPRRGAFEPGLLRGGAYIPLMQAIFREEGVPEDLVYMAQVESAFKPHAYSRAKAKGYWQFIAGTARRYGLRRDWWIDERSDFERATRAAASYLRDLHGMFGDWYLAMAAYNAGEGKIQRALQRTGKSDFWSIAKTRELRVETKNYVPAILATIVIAHSPEKFGFFTEGAQPLAYDRVVLDDPIDLRVAARCAGTSVEILRDLNPALYRLQTPPDYERFALNLPAGAGPAFELVASALPDSDRFLTVKHTVRKGETMAAVARRYGVSTSALAGANGLSSRSSLRAGATLTIPSNLAPIAGSHPDAPGSNESRSSRTSSSSHRKTTTYKVVRGDTLYSIARRFGTSVDALRTANHLSSRSTLQAGQRLVVRGSAVSSGSSGSTAARTAARTAAKPSGSTSAKSKSGSQGAFPYTVRKGDTLARIAAVHGTNIDSICRWNGLSRNAVLRVGTRLTLYR